MTGPTVLIVLPCFNERDAIGGVLREIYALNQGYDVLVIDDGSTDDTCEVARRQAPCVRLVRNLGIGGAVQTGIKYAARRDYDFCIQIDGDGQHPPSQIGALLDGHARAPANIVIGSRYINNDTFRSTLARRLGSKLIAASINLLFGGGRITDPTSGMRLMDRRAIALFARQYPHDFPEPISLAHALRNGCKVAEVPVQMREREFGTSSIMGFRPLAYMVRVIAYIALIRFTKTD